MIILFTIGNFRSFKEQSTLSLATSALKDIQVGERVNIGNFHLNSLTATEPSFFEAVFSDESNQYRYGFEADNSLVHSEWLYQKAIQKRAKEMELFYRERDEFMIHPKFVVSKELAGKRMVRANALLLSVAAQFQLWGI